MTCLGTVSTSQAVFVFELWTFRPNMETVADIALWCFGAFVLIILLDHIVDCLFVCFG